LKDESEKGFTVQRFRAEGSILALVFEP